MPQPSSSNTSRYSRTGVAKAPSINVHDGDLLSSCTEKLKHDEMEMNHLPGKAPNTAQTHRL